MAGLWTYDHHGNEFDITITVVMPITIMPNAAPAALALFVPMFGATRILSIRSLIFRSIQ